MPTPWTLAALLVLPTLPYAWRADGPETALPLAVGGLVLLASTAARARSRAGDAGPWVRAIGLVGVALPWAWFWVEDLHRARFAVVLVAVPAAAIGALLLRRRPADAVIGALAALTGIWAALAHRADNGCTGVSATYSALLGLHPLVALAPAPWLYAAPRRRDDL